MAQGGHTRFSSTNQPKKRGDGTAKKGKKHRITSLREAFYEVALNHVVLEEELKQLLHTDRNAYFKIMATLEPKKVEVGGAEDLPPIKIDFLPAGEVPDDE